MKVAIGFFGVLGGAGKGSSDGKQKEILQIAVDHYRKNIFEPNEKDDTRVDTFCHSWSKPFEDQIARVINPSDLWVEEQEVFDVPSWVGPFPERNQAHYSRWRSTQKVMQLVEKAEETSHTPYDIVMLTRYDIAFQKPFVFSEYEPGCFWIQPWCRPYKNGKLVSNKDFYRVKDQLGEIVIKHEGWPFDEIGETRNALLDFFFFSSSRNMKKFGALYGHLNEYLKPGNCPRNEAGAICNHRLALHHLTKLGLESNIQFCDHHLHCGNNGDGEVTLIRRSFLKSGK